MFAYINYGDGAEYISDSSNEKKEYYYEMIIAVDNASNVTITVNETSIYVTEKDLKKQQVTVELTTAITANTNYTIPLSYQVRK